LTEERSTAARSLRAVSLAITLVSIVTFSTVIYSAYQDAEGLVGSGTGAGISVGNTLSGGNMTIVVNATVLNRGLYPISFGVLFSARADGELLSQSSSSPVSVQPGGVSRATFSTTISFLSVKDTNLLRKILLNGSSVVLSANVTAGLVPFARMGISSNQSIEFAPPMGKLSVGPGAITRSGGGTAVTLPVSFVNEQNFRFDAAIYCQLYSGGTVVASSGTYAISVQPGGSSTVTISLSSPGQLSPGRFVAVLHVILPGVDLPIRTGVLIR
jgi:hypothetical protein